MAEEEVMGSSEASKSSSEFGLCEGSGNKSILASQFSAAAIGTSTLLVSHVLRNAMPILFRSPRVVTPQTSNNASMSGSSRAKFRAGVRTKQGSGSV